MHLLVTGGAGFIGANFVQQTVRERPEHKVTVLDALTYAGNRASLEPVADAIEFVHGSIADEALVDQLVGRCDVVVNFAAESHNDNSLSTPEPFLQTNLVGTFRLLEAVRAHGKRLHHVSTDEVFGDLELDDAQRFTEDTAYRPSSPYSSTKAGADLLVRAWVRSFGIAATISNCSNNYGPYHFPEKLIPLVILTALRGGPLPVYGDGQQVRDWLYVEDHCRAITTVLEKGALGETYNVGGHNERANLDVVKTICALLDELAPDSPHAPHEQLITFVTDRPGHDRRYAIDAGKIERDLGWTPEETFESGMEKTVRWYLENRDWCEGSLSGKYRGERLGLGSTGGRA